MKLLIEKYDGALTNSVYGFSKKKDKISLTYSVLGNWIPKGKQAYSLEDTGNGFVFIDSHLDKEIYLDYAQATTLAEMLIRLGAKAEYALLQETK